MYSDSTVEEKLKQQQYAESMAKPQPQPYDLAGGLASGATFGNASQQCVEPMRQTLTGRIDARLYRAEKESRNNERLRELQYLLNKHPEIARILDLLDADLLQGL